MLRTRMLVLQPTPYCNVSCDYCYLKSRDQRSIMDLATIEAIAERVIAHIEPQTETVVVWHGGEATTVPLEWYRSAYSKLRVAKGGIPLAFSIQTNGVALSDAWTQFFVDTKTQVGLSLDGPEYLHNRYRHTRSGGGTWHLAMRALDTLRRRGIEPGIITVLTAEALNYPLEMLAFYTQHGINDVSFSVEEREGANVVSSLDISGIENVVEEFLVCFLRGIIENNLPIRLREAERILGLLAAGEPAYLTNEQTTPFACITIDWSGGLYTYSPEFTEHAAGEWDFLRVGNIREQSLSEICRDPRLRRLIPEVSAGLIECRSRCEFWEICGGGSPVNRLAEHGSLAVPETQFCRLTVQATARALHRLVVRDSIRQQ